MKLTVEQILSAKPVLEKLHKAELDFVPGFLVGRLIQQLRAELATAEAAHIKVFEKFGVKSSHGDKVQYIVPPEKMEEFQAALLPVLSISIEVAVDLVPLSALSQAPRGTVDDIMALLPFVDPAN